MSTLSISPLGGLNQNEINCPYQVITAPLPIPNSKPLIWSSGLESPDNYGNGVKKAHVIVVGAVLEGRPDRIGGRIHTSRNPKTGKARDIGAAWMHETSQNKMVQLIKKLDIEYYYDDGTPLYFTKEGRAGSQFKAKKVADEFADYCEHYFETHPHAPDRSVKEFMNEFVENHPLITNSERKWAPQAIREVELWIGTSIEEASSKYLSYFAPERNLYMKGGYDKIINWAAKPLLKDSETIKMGEVVKNIQWGEEDNSVVVDTLKGDKQSTFKADAIAVTVPLGCLRMKMINFEPALPEDIQEDTPVDELSILSYATVTSNCFIMSGTKELCIQIAEPLTQRIEVMTSTQEIYDFFEPLFKLMRTEPYKDLPDFLNLETTHWTQDALAGFGSYSVEKTGDDSELLMEALENHNRSRLQFAGEHCTVVGNGCVHGAFETGEVAARNLLEALGIQYDGNDTTAQSVSL
ncbi:hypothetical protein DID88_009847 [Monilinia fructigena]|uniref:Amine oxidase domain-containing protein n=1 Tax=Monilinia fructigena TaxID=38457 RepID=A0A395IK40_9HELO|nr:hypothetical protein DID88_009847 [Monilinia fructigena]